MATPSHEDGSEDVADFLERIKELGDKRQREDEERARKLEEEILQGRKERQARRAERARSISPTKDSPLASISSLQNTPGRDSPLSHTAAALRSSRGDGSPGNSQADLSFVEPSKPSPPPSSLSRSGTLSWQQRPKSRGSPVRSRPLSLIATENAARSPRSTPEPSTEESEQSLSQKAKALETKDPSWFRQTPDRGVGSAAYRKNQDSQDSFSGSIRLPGLSREPSMDPEIMSTQEQSTSLPEPAPSLTRDSSSPTHNQAPSTARQSDTAKSPFPVSASQRFQPPPADPMKPLSRDQSPSRAPAMSPSQGRISPDRMDRPASPTKGLGGFVQSAMLKRSDSVSKRLSQQTPGLSRGNSIANSRGTPTVASKPSSLRNDNDSGSQHSPTVGLQKPPHDPTEDNSSPEASKDSEFVRPPLPSRDSQKSVPDQVPTEYSRTMDPKRFSPNKPSWLESALNRQEPPPRIKPAAPKQPEWMENIAKAKQARGGSVDLNKGVSHKEVAIGGFLRSPPIGTASPSPTAGDGPNRSSVSSSQGFSSPRGSRSGSVLKQEPSLEGADETLKSNSDAAKVISKDGSPVASTSTDVRPPDESEIASLQSTQRPTVKPKPATSPKTDFRSSLKSRPIIDSKDGNNEPEFKKAFSSLRRAETKNYVAPDELKDNILRGKGALNITGGPKKTERVDEFKESILKKRSEFESGKSDLITGNFLNRTKTEKDKPQVPEALAKRQIMSTKPSTVPTTLDKVEPSLPEALAKRQMMASKKPSIGSSIQIEHRSQAVTSYGVDTSSPNFGKKPVTEVRPIGQLPSRQPELQSNIGSSYSSTRPTQAAGSGLAARFNPTLAGIIGRGPSPTKKEISRDSPAEVADSTSAGPEPVHVTKGRARGPKRRGATQPSSDSQAVSEPVKLETASPLSSSKPIDSSSQTNIVPRNDLKTPPATKPKRVPSVMDEPSFFTQKESQPASLISSTAKSPRSPPIPAKKSTSIVASPATPARTPLDGKEQTHAYCVLRDFFTDLPGSIKGRIEINTEAILTKPADVPDKIRTKSNSIWKITGDGKKISVPDQYSNTLFDEEMYLVTHTYRSSDWKEIIDVYLWVGDKVGTAELEDARIFSRSEARSAGGSLITVHQGKEPFNFFEAFGGIVVIRFGNSKRLEQSWDNFVLCGRQHMGQIAFDELPLHESSLSHGFPYIICKDGNMYLWKGVGSTTAEISSALLTGNIIGSNASREMAEIAEGNETDNFWAKTFGGDGILPGTDVDWTRKKGAKSFQTRLFQVEVETASRFSSSSLMSWAGRRGSSPESPTNSVDVKEIAPYIQQDIQADKVYVLDSWFKIIVVVPKGASKKLAAFRAALFFAQEYSMLAASLEDRPFIPSGIVEFGSGSEDLRMAFRKWVPEQAPLKEGQETLGLNEALQAM